MIEELEQAVGTLSAEQRKQVPSYWLLMAKIKVKGKGC
jgi:hypothetical protein